MHSNRKIFFGAGPAVLPQSVLEAMADAVLDYAGTGISLLSMGHREKAFGAILDEANALVLQLAHLSADDYEVLWLQGGGRHQFAMVPMNFLGEGQTAGYIDSGFWAHDAMKAATYYGNAKALSSSAADQYQHLPEWPLIPNDLQYLHITTNNTIYGTQMPEIPEVKPPLVADMSSDLFSEERDYGRCAMFYAVAQKNLGPAGVTLVVLRKDFLGKQVRTLPEVFCYAAQAKAKSLLNTPPVAAIYGCLLMLRWIAARGIKEIAAENKLKADLLYSELERNPNFEAIVERESRSKMNVVFRMRDEAKEKLFLEYSAARQIEGIKGHRSVGGFRASLYNAVRLEDVKALVRTMQQFE